MYEPLRRYFFTPPLGKLARKSHISLGFIQWSFRNRKKAVGRLMVRMKATDGKRIHQDRYSKKDLAKLLALNLIGVSPKTGVMWQRSWPEIHRILGIKAISFYEVTHTVLDKYSYADIAYSAALQYMFRLQEDGRTLHGKPSKKKRVHMHPSVHIGGIAHSLLMKFFGMSLGWSQKRRKSCHARGLVKFTRRKAPEREFPDGHEKPKSGKPYKAWDVTSLAEVRVVFRFSVPRCFRHLLERRVWDARQGCYVYLAG